MFVLPVLKNVNIITEEERILTKKSFLPTYTLGEDLANAISHGIGACLSVAALVLCVVQAARHGTAAGVVGASVLFSGADSARR